MNSTLKALRSAAALLFLCVCSSLCSISPSYAQQSIPRVVSYQGQIKTSENVPLSGNHKVSVAFYSNMEGTDIIWKGEYEALFGGGYLTSFSDRGITRYPKSSTARSTSA